MLVLGNQRSSSPFLVVFRALFVVPLWAPIPLLLAGAIFYGALQDNLPSTPSILEPPPGSATQVFTLDGRPVGGLHRGLAPWARYDEIPPLVLEAFLAAEDDDYFLHEGVDIRAIVRAALANWRAGSVQQGGSTITQQLAKMFVGHARTYERKLLELMLSRRLEATYSKEQILEAYLNRIYLGAGAYGVRAAARIYFDHSLEGLTVAEAATLAGIASAPSSFEPYDHPERARARRDLVVNRMASLGFLPEHEALLVRESAVELRERGENPAAPLPYTTDQIRRDIRNEFGRDAWRYGALEVVTATSLSMQRYGEQALLRGVEEVDRRQGYRGPLRTETGLSHEQFTALVDRHFPRQQLMRPALVDAVDETGLTVWIDGAQAQLGPESWSWASPYDPESSENAVERETTDGLVSVGDVVLVIREEGTDRFLLSQMPRLQGALASVDLSTDYVTAMVGGIDYDGSQFNRVTRGCRQPGSVFKPVIYSRALDMGMTLATPLIDVPMQLFQGGIETWRPRNADGDFQGDLMLRDALIRSRNLPTIRVFKRIGAYSVIERARQLGFTTPMEHVDALSLGASCVYPIEVASAYGVFANRGFLHRPTTVVSIVDGRGELVSDRGTFFDGTAAVSTMVHRAFRDLTEHEGPVLDPRTAYLLTFVLHDVIRMGTAYGALELGFPAAGKTGTTNAFDAWFVGYTQRLVTTVWVGSDRNTRPLGRGEHGAEVALPIWVDFMSSSLSGLEQASLVEPRPPGINLIKVDLLTGLLAQEGAPGVWLPFREGTEPQQYAPTPEQRDMAELDRLGLEF